MDIDALIVHVCACTAWTWDYVANNVTLARLSALQDYWKEYPPVHVLVRAFMRYESPKERAISQREELKSLAGRMGAKVTVQKHGR